MGLKYFTVAFSKTLYFYSQKKCHITAKWHITAKIQKTEFDKYSTSLVSAFSITSI